LVVLSRATALFAMVGAVVGVVRSGWFDHFALMVCVRFVIAGGSLGALHV